MDAPVRYPELFLATGDGTPQSYWTSLSYFNLYRVALAALFFGIALVYGDALGLGSHALAVFQYASLTYLAGAVAFQWLLHRSHERFNIQLSLQLALDIVAITLLMYSSGGVRSGLGVMLLISLTGAAILAPRRLSYLYAALAAIALLLEQGYWVLAYDSASANFLQPGLLAIGCFATAGVTSWLAQRVAANEALARQRGRSLETQTRVNQLVIEDLHDGVVVLDRDSRVVQHNPQAQRLLGGERLLGRPIAEILPGFGAATDFEVRGRSLGARMLDTGTEEVFRVLFLEDTTRSREEAQQLKLAALGRLTANIAHEIRNPLAAISHAAELLGEERRDAQRVRLTRIIHDNTLRLERLVSEVLQLSRRDRQAPQRIRLRRWLMDFVEEFVANESVPPERFALETPGEALKTPGEALKTAGEAWIEFDPAHLHQVMWNLLANAVRYARAEAGAIRISARAVADRVELSVIDNGPGVPRSSQGQLFEPFFTTDSKGTGLGLYLARELCAANRALLEYVRESSGAHFRVVARASKA
jgi:two-component system sensor histidine kinase PilS (NtrC family)